MEENQKIVWLNGEEGNCPPGKLLSDNIGYYGECILTGMTYQYLTPLSGIGDTENDIAELRGGRLIDGNLHGRYRKQVPECRGGILQVQMDFQRMCSFQELDLIARCHVASILVETSEDGDCFKEVFQTAVGQDKELYRCRLQESVAGQYIRLTLCGEDAMRLWQVWVWGDVLQTIAEANPGEKQPDFFWANSISLQSLMGIPQTAFSDMEGFLWMKKLRAKGYDQLPAVWSQLSAYDPLSAEPILPEPDYVNTPISLRLCRNSVEVACLALTNTDTSRPKDVTVELENPSPLRAELSVCGTMPTRWYGITVGPLINEQATICRPLLHKYVTNASVLCDFPTIHLPAGGSCLFWLKLYGGETAPGQYSIKLCAGESIIPIQAQVLPLRLEGNAPGVWLWANDTSPTMTPFVYADRAKREAAYRNEVGTNVYWGWPTPGSTADEARKANPDTYFMILGLGRYSDLLYNGALQSSDITDEVEREVASLLEEHIRQAQRYQVDFDHWFLEMPDEPGVHNAKAMGLMIRLCKKLHPEIRIYVNPSFWAGFDRDAVADDELLCDCLDEWYAQVDVSVPLVLNLTDRPQARHYFTHTRLFNGQYNVSSQHMGSDRAGLLHLPRISAWDSISRDMNWWGFYSYHQPRLDCWNNIMCPELDEDATINYQCVYAGVNGPVPTRASELIREGVQDYRLMKMLRQADSKLYVQLQREYLEGNRNFMSLKNRVLDRLLELKS